MIRIALRLSGRHHLSVKNQEAPKVRKTVPAPGKADGATAVRLAMFGELRQVLRPTVQNGEKWIYGAWLATSDLLHELLKAGLVGSLDCFAAVARSATARLVGRECREFPFTDFPLEAKLNDYQALFSYFGWNSGLPSLRAQLLPRASHIQVVHSMHYERTLWDFGCNFYWEMFAPQDAIVCTSPTAVRTMKSMIEYWQERSRLLRGKKIAFPARIVEIPLGVALPGPQTRESARARLGWDADELTILVVGRLSSFDKMDHGAILALLARLSRKVGRRLQFVFAGEDTAQTAKRLMQAARKIGLADRLRMYTNCDFGLRDTLYAASDIFLSLVDHVQETFGLTILEAMAHGRPVVAADWGGYRDLVQHGRSGLLVPTYWGGRLDNLGMMASIDSMTSAYEVSRRTAVDLGEAENALIKLIGSEQMRQSMGRAGRERIEELFTWPRVVARYRELWAELAEARTAASRRPRALPVPRGQPYAQIFGHYPTRRIEGGDRVGRREGALQGNPLFLLSSEVEQRTVREILLVLEGGTQTISRCIDCVAARLGIAPAKVEDHLLLAAKYGLVDVTPGKRSRPVRLRKERP